MTLTDPREALADQSSFIGYLIGLAGLGQRGACAGRRRPPSRLSPAMPTTSSTCCSALRASEQAVERLAESAPRSTALGSRGTGPRSTNTRWLR